MRFKLLIGGAVALLGCGCATVEVEPAARVEAVGVDELPALRKSSPPRVKKMNPRLKRFLQANVKEIDFKKGSSANSYVCALTFTQAIAAENQDFAREYFRNRVIDSYMNECGTTAQYVGVSITSDRAVGEVYTAEAVAFEVEETVLAYDPVKRRGVMGLRIRDEDMEATRKLVRANIEALARDKNVRLTTGELPPQGRFYLLDERVVKGNLLEIEFEVE